MNAMCPIALRPASTTATTRAHIAPPNNATPARIATMPKISRIQPHWVRSNTSRPCRLTVVVLVVEHSAQAVDHVERAGHDQHDRGEPDPADPRGGNGPAGRP